MRMSGEPSWAMTEPSRNSTRPWTTDCAWTTTSSSSGASANKCCASINSRPLFIRVAELIVIFGPIDQVGCLSACSTVTLRIASSDQVRNGPPEAVRTMRRTSSRRPALKRLKDGVVLGIDRQHRGAGGSGPAHEQRAGADQALLVGERHGRAAFGRSKRRLKAGRAGDRRHHPIGRPLRSLDHGCRPGRRFDPRAGKLGFQVRHRRPGPPPRQSARRVRAPDAPGPRHCGARSPPRPDSVRARGAADRPCSSRSSRWRQAASPSAAPTPIRCSHGSAFCFM